MQTFTPYGPQKNQIIVATHDPDGKKELIVTVNDADSLDIDITLNEETTGKFSLHKDSAQKLVDWLRLKGYVA